MKFTAFLAAVLVSAAVQAQDYPSRPIRFVVPYPPGALTDMLARAIGERLGTALKQPVRGREPARRGHAARRGVGRQGARRRLHAADGDLAPRSASARRSIPSRAIDPVKDFAPCRWSAR